MKSKKLFGFVLACVLTVAMVTPVMAETVTPDKNIEVTYDGKSLSTANVDLSQDIAGVQPGDTVSIAVDLNNASSNSSYYYMNAAVVKSLEDDSKARNGAYTFSLVYKDANGKETVLYSNDRVGGDAADDATNLGLKQVQLTGDGEYIYLDTIAANSTGKVLLNVSLDGRTQNNDYMSALSELELAFAVENVQGPKSETRTSYTPGTVVKIPGKNTIVTRPAPKTGDVVLPMVLSIAGFGCGLILLVVAILLMKRRNEKEAQ